VTEEVRIRRAQEGDVKPIARLAADLVRMHHAVDPGRFLLVDRVEEGYGWWLSRELARAEAVVLGAFRGEHLVGYAYGTLEDRDWNRLLDAHGAVHDVYVETSHRRHGVGRSLVVAIVAALEHMGAARIVLSTMVGNVGAQALFQACGFRPTMLEMTRS
jgi:ribosomal protein S18 acetylase RimI-like enzyme